MSLISDSINTLERARIQTSTFEAEILLQGAALMHFAPRGQSGWIFQSDATPFAPTREIYGGVPIVFPWFVRLPATATRPITVGRGKRFGRCKTSTKATKAQPLR
jgi:D-hexose-6-phosphate mutarotase